MSISPAYRSQTTADDEVILLNRIARRDAAALTELYQLTLSRVYAVAMRVLRHAADAEEVVSDVYLQIWDKVGQFEQQRGSAAAWMNTLTWSRAVDRLRKSKRDIHQAALHPDHLDDAYTDCEELSVEQLAESWSSASTIQKAFEALSDIQQQALRLAYTEDLSHQEIANALSLPLGTVKSHIKRGLTALRGILAVEEKR